MVAGLAFLSKKSWHTKNISNQEKVWVAEQRKEQEEAKAKELAKQIQQEREQEELDKIAGKKSARIDRGIDWMYHGQQKNSEIAQEDAAKKSEEYLLGKAYVPEGGTQGDFDAGANVKEGVNAIIEAKKTPPEERAVHQEPSVAERNEAFRHRHEDPMFAVAMEAKHKKDEHQKKTELFERVVGVRDEDDDDEHEENEKDSKRRRKEKKHKKKKKHRKRRHYSTDEETSVEERRHHHRKRHQRSRTPDSLEDRHRRRRSRSRDREEYSGRHGDRHHHRRYRDEDSVDDSYDRRRSRGKRDRHRSRSPDYSRDRDEKKYYHRDDRHRDDDRPHDRYARRRSRSNSPDHTQQQAKKPGYGLQGSSSLKQPPTDLGPDQELLRKKRQEREEQKERNRNQSSRRNMTEEERKAALREMEESARQYQTRREERPDREDDSTNPVPQASAAFLHNVAKKAHGVTDGSVSLHERISQNRSTNQRLHEDFV